MKLSSILPVAAFAMLLPLALFAESMPRMTTVEPGTAKAGDVLNVAGENLDVHSDGLAAFVQVDLLHGSPRRSLA